MTTGPGTTRRRVVVASDAFRGSLTSAEVGEALRAGVLAVLPDADVAVVPVADGGEGTVSAALAAGYTAVPAVVHGPTGEPVRATMAWSSTDGTVVVELADACGLSRLPGGVLRPLEASSRGLGEVVGAALDLRPHRLVVGVGGSASTDGGAGMLAALGARVLDAEGHPVPDGGAGLSRVARADLGGLDPRLLDVDLVLAADVTSPLLGPHGAAAVFAPQKGATPEDVARLEAALTRWADVLNPGSAAVPGSGAAGGVGFAMVAALGATRRSGVDVVLDLVGLDPRLPGADLVITGEGSLDAQTATGKAVAGVARRAGSMGVPTVAVCGRTTLGDIELHGLGLASAYPLSELEPDPERSMAEAAALLHEVGSRIARERLSPPG
ncbi:glycerate kinase [uncultured Phycicoccus sp.]|uniref:glycerate kinase n=1 Tax=uncultured Phycicoccus sp. TaxID=661422 RepID=UPI00263014E7|nr:glycerate kinase [uncultured Phycicoccus sp.]